MRGNKFYKFLDLFIGTILVLLLRCVGFKRRHGFNASPKNIGIIKLAAMGDTLLLVPILRKLRTTYPEVNIVFIGTKINEELVHLFPKYTDRFLCFDIRQSLHRPCSFFLFLKKLRSRNFDVVLDFEQWSMITPIMTALSGAKAAAGFSLRHRMRHLLY